MEDLVIYEAHVRGFTAHPSSGVAAPGTYAGLVERLDYLAALGVTALELMPVHEFNELEYHQADAAEGAPARYNFWGYSTVGYFAPMARFSAGVAGGAAGAAADEFRELVKACHRRGIEVILDVVFNHTAEGSEAGPTLSFRGLDNRVYYMLAPGGECYNYSGCGNTFNCNHPVARAFILDCLRYWVEEMHVDGFRFDLGSIMTRAHSKWHAQGAPPAETAGEAEAEAGADVVDDGAASGWSEEEEWAAGAGAAPLSGGAIVNKQGARLPGGAVELVAARKERGGRRRPALPVCAAPAPRGVRSLPALPAPAGNMTDGAGVPTGTPLADPALIAAISADPVLAGTKLIAEAWDCDGLNQVGAFPHYGGRWSEWNGHFRDTTRQFVKGTDGSWAGGFASALCGSPNVYANGPGEDDWWGNNAGRRWKGGRGPTASVNFVTAHDGFTLADLVSYNEKHNETNGEGNRDGESHNLSWNCGAEGPSGEAGVAALRQRQMRNFTAALLLAHGVPMILMGDEYGHSKGGNNNTYCHDSPLNWLDWDAAAADEGGLLRFTRHMIALRRAHKELRRGSYVAEGEVEWHGVAPNEPDWAETSRFLALTLRKAGAAPGGLYVAFNSGHLPQMVELPRWEGRAWQPLVDTGKAAPYDILVADEALPEGEVAAARAALGMWTLEHAYPMLPWSCVVLESVPEAAIPAMPAQRRARGAPGAGPLGLKADAKAAPKRKAAGAANGSKKASVAAAAAAAEGGSSGGADAGGGGAAP
jgi:isoamylase